MNSLLRKDLELLFKTKIEYELIENIQFNKKILKVKVKEEIFEIDLPYKIIKYKIYDYIIENYPEYLI